MSCDKGDPVPQIQYDGTVVIIGAGAAGLYAADILQTKGVKIQLLEATKQLGGRVRSLRNQQDLPYQSIADFPVELGAEFFQGSDSIWGKIISNLNLETVNLTTVATDQYIIERIVKDAAGWGADVDFNAVQRFVSGLKNYAGAARSVRDAAGEISARGQELLNARIGNFYGSSNDKVGIKGLSDQLKLVKHDLNYHTLKHNAMQDVVISRFSDVLPNVKLESPVKSINYSSDPVVITLENGEKIEGNKVIVTVPVSILKKGITFTPALPAAKTSALERIGMDASMRIILDFKKNFWGETSGFIWGSAKAPQMLNSGASRSEFYRTLSLTVNGSKATELASLGSDEQIVKQLLAELDLIYDGKATLFIRTGLPPNDEEKMIYFIKDWTKDTYAQGGYCYPLTSTSLDDHAALADPVEERLFFAGEATDFNGDAGTVNGAMASAERVADDVAKSILGV